jgi:hypothetical protein
MKRMTLTDLQKLSQDLDIFVTQKEENGHLLSRGIYRPLPVSGDYLIHGFSLCQKATKEGIDELSVVLLPEMDKEDLMILALECENRAGTYSWPEIEKIISFVEQDKKPGKSLIPLIQGHDDPEFLKKYTLYKQSTHFLKECINKQFIDFKTAQQVRDLPDNIFQSLLAYKEKNKISFSQVRIFLTTLYEIFMRDKCSTREIIAQCESFLACKHPLEAVKKIRYPELTAMYEELESIKQKTVKSRGITLSEPPYFEGSSFHIEFHFQSKKQLHKKIMVLQELEEKADELFHLL